MKSSRASRKRKKGKKKNKRTLADRADPFVLYQQSVQNPECDIDFFVKAYKRLRGCKPRSFREDFCGTAHLATQWVKGHRKRTAIGIDLDEPTLAWARKHVVGRQKRHVRERIELVQANVLDVIEPKVDLSCALNFSFCVFKEREELLRYFRAAHECLAEDGVFITELYGGTEAIDWAEDERDVKNYTYIWEQEKYNPITNETLCHISFAFADGSRLDHAYTYDWRLWSVPEVRECLTEVGFSSVDIYWEKADKSGEGTGKFYRTEEEENQATWLSYIVAAR